MSETILKLDPMELAVHPVKKLVPDEWSKEDGRYIALVEDIRDRGIDEPLQIDKEHRILEGRRRWRAAKQLQLATVPVIVRADSDEFSYVLQGLVQRGHYSKGQLAYLTYPLMEGAAAEARGRRLEMLKKPNFSRSALSALRGADVKTAVELADVIGVGRRVFFQAQEVHQAFKDTTKYEFETGEGTAQLTLKEYFEPRILDAENPAGLGAVVAGIAGMKATKGKPKRQAEQLLLFEQGWETVRKRAAYWAALDAEQKRAARACIEATVAGMPEDLRAEFAGALRKVGKK